MRLTGVTLTGADESVSAYDLVQLSKRYPFVEWGILRSAKRQGTYVRYPSKNWIEQLSLTIQRERVPARFANHFCGEYAIEKGWHDPWVQRSQLNGVADLEGTQQLKDHKNHRWIVQVRSPQEFDLVSALPHDILLDPSGGAGKESTWWEVGRPNVGFAGGITPDNVVVKVSHCMTLTGHDFWIDMESGVRSDAGRTFDLKLCESVLSQTEKFVVSA